MTVVGKGFGQFDLTQRVRLGSTGCLATGWLADSTVLCKLPADTNSNLGVTLSVERDTKYRAKIMSYDDPLITAIWPTNVPLTNPARVSLFGFNFGGQVHDPRQGRFGDTSCLNVEWKSDTSISCMSQPGYAQNLYVTVTIAEMLARRVVLSYNVPVITSLFRSNGPASGTAELTIFGQSFGGFELTPLLKLGDTFCMRTQWIAESSVICKSPRVPYSRETPFMGGKEPVQIFIGSSSDKMEDAYTYDMACVGPCVIALACESSTGSYGCNGPTHGDYRHPLNADGVAKKKFDKKAVVRVIGNFTLYRPTLDVLVGNTTENQTIQAVEHTNDDVKIVFGGMYECIPIKINKIEGEKTSEQYVDCVLPMGVGHGHSIQVTIRNATYKALLDGCTYLMKLEPKGADVNGYWPPLLNGEVPDEARFVSNCLVPSSIEDKDTLAEDIGVSFSYNAPVVSLVNPFFGPNSKGDTATITITGSNFGGEARRVWQQICQNSMSRSCQQLFTNGISLFNTSCNNINLLLTPSTGPVMQAEAIKRQLAYCKEKEAYMIKCEGAFAKENLVCETVCPPGLAPEDDLEDLCKTFCSEDTLICEVRAFGGSQEVNVVVGDQTIGESKPFLYKSPILFSVFPPELSAGTSSLLTGLYNHIGVARLLPLPFASACCDTCAINCDRPRHLAVKGINFGVDLPSEYGGRVYRMTDDGKEIVLKVNPEDVPFNESSIEWWDWAQYSTCFSTQTDVQPVTPRFEDLDRTGLVDGRLSLEVIVMEIALFLLIVGYLLTYSPHTRRHSHRLWGAGISKLPQDGRLSFFQGSR